ncbi:MAG TPA: GNAT family N-acetyltransferase [Anaerolineales bacterium]|nr:GNAT family N-acetyltransferase [Anaerolineales bacterium]
MINPTPDSQPLSGKVRLRKVQKADLPTFFIQQMDPEAVYMAAFTAKDPSDWAAFQAHWAKIMADKGITIRTILLDGKVAGNILSHAWFGDLEVSYWLGKDHWDQGVATCALQAFLKIVKTRPLYGRVAKDNFGSKRVLEKNGFKIVGEGLGFANGRGTEVEEWVLKLDS